MAGRFARRSGCAQRSAVIGTRTHSHRAAWGLCLVLLWGSWAVAASPNSATSSRAAREDAVRLIKSLDAFFARADKGQEGDERVIEIISGIEAAMADRRITPEEAEGLIDMAGPRGEGG